MITWSHDHTCNVWSSFKYRTGLSTICTYFVSCTHFVSALVTLATVCPTQMCTHLCTHLCSCAASLFPILPSQPHLWSRLLTSATTKPQQTTTMKPLRPRNASQGKCRDELTTAPPYNPCSCPQSPQTLKAPSAFCIPAFETFHHADRNRYPLWPVRMRAPV